jgi:hypothetical protein
MTENCIYNTISMLMSVKFLLDSAVHDGGRTGDETSRRNM